ncbi:MAG: hypothetical protein U9Q63_04175, partial [Patescibacteria group bacterium]|nr:hypothetical protein [Patescibacteria group bacterium]
MKIIDKTVNALGTSVFGYQAYQACSQQGMSSDCLVNGAMALLSFARFSMPMKEVNFQQMRNLEMGDQVINTAQIIVDCSSGDPSRCADSIAAFTIGLGGVLPGLGDGAEGLVWKDLDTAIKKGDTKAIETLIIKTAEANMQMKMYLDSQDMEGLSKQLQGDFIAVKETWNGMFDSGLLKSDLNIDVVQSAYLDIILIRQKIQTELVITGLEVGKKLKKSEQFEAYEKALEEFKVNKDVDYKKAVEDLTLAYENLKNLEYSKAQKKILAEIEVKTKEFNDLNAKRGKGGQDNLELARLKVDLQRLNQEFSEAGSANLIKKIAGLFSGNKKKIVSDEEIKIVIQDDEVKRLAEEDKIGKIEDGLGQEVRDKVGEKLTEDISIDNLEKYEITDQKLTTDSKDVETLKTELESLKTELDGVNEANRKEKSLEVLLKENEILRQEKALLAKDKGVEITEYIPKTGDKYLDAMIENLIRQQEAKINSVWEKGGVYSIRKPQIEASLKAFMETKGVLVLKTSGGKTSTIGPLTMSLGKELFGMKGIFVAKQGQGTEAFNVQRMIFG